MTIQSNSSVQFDDVEALFAADLDDIADLPSFEVPPKGAYIGRVTTAMKQINDKMAVEATFEVVETVELKNPEDAPCVPGTKFSTAFMLGNEVGAGKMKEFLAPFAQHFDISGPGSIGRLIRDEIKDVTIAFTLKHRADKNDKERIYPDVSNITVA